MELFDNRSKRRAVKTLKCLPLNLNFYIEAKASGLNAEMVFKHDKHYGVEAMRWFNHVNEVEDTFTWLIKIGVLRREVDGQGLTSLIRLTPLGRELLEKEPNLPALKASFLERSIFRIFRTFSLP